MSGTRRTATDVRGGRRGIFTGNAGRKDAAAIRAEYAQFFAQDEQVYAAFGVVR